MHQWLFPPSIVPEIPQNPNPLSAFTAFLVTSHSCGCHIHILRSTVHQYHWTILCQETWVEYSSYQNGEHQSLGWVVDQHVGVEQNVVLVGHRAPSTARHGQDRRVGVDLLGSRRGHRTAASLVQRWTRIGLGVEASPNLGTVNLLKNKSMCARFKLHCICSAILVHRPTMPRSRAVKVIVQQNFADIYF